MRPDDGPGPFWGAADISVVAHDSAGACIGTAKGGEKCAAYCSDDPTVPGTMLPLLAPQRAARPNLSASRCAKRGSRVAKVAL